MGAIEKKRKKETQNANIPYIRIPIVRDEWGRMKVTFYLPKSMEQEFERFIKLCRQDELSYSRVLCRLIKTWLQHHEPGNPQKTLVEEDFEPPYQYSLFPVVRRKQLMEDLLATIKSNRQVPIRNIIAAFSKESGLRIQTVREYVKTLKESGALRRTS